MTMILNVTTNFVNNSPSSVQNEFRCMIHDINHVPNFAILFFVGIGMSSDDLLGIKAVKKKKID